MIFPLNPTIYRDGRLTDEEFYAFCQANPTLRIEREADGQIIFEMPTNTETSLTNAALNGEVYVWNRTTELGYVFDSNGRFTLIDTSVRAPDMPWISRARWDALPEEKQNKFAAICPDFVIELMSDSDEKYTLPAKMEKYLQNGVQLGWGIDPFNSQTTIYRPNAEPETKSFDDELSGEDILPGFTLRLREIMN